jgi:multimeric flavodoxin WrbA
MAITALAFNCTLKRGGADSSTDRILSMVASALDQHDIRTEIVRAVDHDIKPGVTADEGPGDAWPALREKLLAADIIILGTPIWLGQPSSVAKRVMERMDAFLDETDEAERMPTFGKVAAVCVVGNEDGAHHCCAQLFQALNDVGFTIPAAAGAYWVGEAYGGTDFKNLAQVPEKTQAAVDMLAANCAHLARLLAERRYHGTP